MLQIADELSMEAGFVLPPRAPRADLRLRFFTRRREAVLSGHVAIGAMVSLVDRGFYQATADGLHLSLETEAGVLPVVLRALPEGAAAVRLGLPKPRFGEPVPAAEIGAALDMDPEIFQLHGHGPQRVSCGFDQIVIPVGDRTVMRGAFQDMQPFHELADRRGAASVTMFCPDTFGQGVDFHCRFFCPSATSSEDIASGTSLGAVAAFVAEHGLLAGTDSLRIVTEQGHSLGRPCLARLYAGLENERVQTVDVETTGVVVMRGSFHLNDKSLRARA